MDTVIRTMALIGVMLVGAAYVVFDSGLLNGLVSRGPQYVASDYAGDVFSDVLDWEDAIAGSRVQRTLVTACDYVFVRLPVAAPSTPPKSRTVTDRARRFGGLWRPTPMDAGLPRSGDPFVQCRDQIAPDLLDEIGAVMSEPGSFVARDLNDGTLHLYAPGRRLAGRIRVVHPD